ncbi:DUF6931 family protein [Blastopirellula marina]|uniref:Uncharacterized protein n=1 Tax=Blastopirellula marina DSM 3645 TaxID=314230 RepID=A3ZN28_9BACT|nr:hypothetical protein [Blastopirellula marina]EAQ82357.1 hypothetical protein DSM3645_01545 [Blastopirellula marina DSM 3645]
MKTRPFAKHDCCHGSHAQRAAAPLPAAAPLSPLRGDASAVEICQRYKLQLSYDARRLLTPTLAPMIFFDRLLTVELDADARRFLAAALPLRRSLWWAVLTIHDALGDDKSGDSFRLAPVVQWIARPSEPGLLAIRSLDKKVKRGSLWGCLYQAVYSAAGRATPPDRLLAAAPPEMPRRLIGGLVAMAAGHAPTRGYRARVRQYLLLGQTLAQGQAPWTCRNVSPAKETR